nr:D1/D3 ORF [Dictyostelium discoideum]
MSCGIKKKIPLGKAELFSLLSSIHSSSQSHSDLKTMVELASISHQIDELEKCCLQIIKNCTNPICQSSFYESEYSKTLGFQQTQSLRASTFSPETKSQLFNNFGLSSPLPHQLSSVSRNLKPTYQLARSYLQCNIQYLNLFLNHIQSTEKTTPKFPNINILNESSVCSLLYNSFNEVHESVSKFDNSIIDSSMVNFALVKLVLEKEIKDVCILSTYTYTELVYFSNQRPINIDRKFCQNIFKTPSGVNSTVLIPLDFKNHLSLVIIKAEIVEGKVAIKYILHFDNKIDSPHNQQLTFCHEKYCNEKCCLFSQPISNCYFNDVFNWYHLFKFIFYQVKIENGEDISFLNYDEPHVVSYDVYPVSFDTLIKDTDAGYSVIRNAALALETIHGKKELIMAPIQLLELKFKTFHSFYSINNFYKNFSLDSQDILKACKNYATIQTLVNQEILPAGFFYDLKKFGIGFPSTSPLLISISCNKRSVSFYLNPSFFIIYVNKKSSQTPSNAQKIEIDVFSQSEQPFLLYCLFSQSNKSIFILSSISDLIKELKPGQSQVFGSSIKVSYFYNLKYDISPNFSSFSINENDPISFLKAIKLKVQESENIHLEPSTFFITLSKPQTTHSIFASVTNDSLSNGSQFKQYSIGDEEIITNFHFNLSIDQWNYIYLKLKKKYLLNDNNENSNRPQPPPQPPQPPLQPPQPPPQPPKQPQPTIPPQPPKTQQAEPTESQKGSNDIEIQQLKLNQSKYISTINDRDSTIKSLQALINELNSSIFKLNQQSSIKDTLFNSAQLLIEKQKSNNNMVLEKSQEYKILLDEQIEKNKNMANVSNYEIKTKDETIEVLNQTLINCTNESNSTIETYKKLHLELENKIAILLNEISSKQLYFDTISGTYQNYINEYENCFSEKEKELQVSYAAGRVLKDKNDQINAELETLKNNFKDFNLLNSLKISNEHKSQLNDLNTKNYSLEKEIESLRSRIIQLETTPTVSNQITQPAFEYSYKHEILKRDSLISKLNERAKVYEKYISTSVEFLTSINTNNRNSKNNNENTTQTMVYSFANSNCSNQDNVQFVVSNNHFNFNVFQYFLNFLKATIQIYQKQTLEAYSDQILDESFDAFKESIASAHYCLDQVSRHTLVLLKDKETFNNLDNYIINRFSLVDKYCFFNENDQNNMALLIKPPSVFVDSTPFSDSFIHYSIRINSQGKIVHITSILVFRYFPSLINYEETKNLLIHIQSQSTALKQILSLKEFSTQDIFNLKPFFNNFEKVNSNYYKIQSESTQINSNEIADLKKFIKEEVNKTSSKIDFFLVSSTDALSNPENYSLLEVKCINCHSLCQGKNLYISCTRDGCQNNICYNCLGININIYNVVINSKLCPPCFNDSVINKKCAMCSKNGTKCNLNQECKLHLCAQCSKKCLYILRVKTN